MVMPKRVAHLLDEVHHVRGLVRVHPRGRFVEQQQFRLGRERAADLQPPLFAIGEIARQHVAASAQPDEVQQAQRLLVRRALVAHGVRRAQHRTPPGGAQVQMHSDQQILDCGDVAEQADVLIGAADSGRGDAIRRQAVDRSRRTTLRRGRPQVLRDAVEYRGLAGAVWPDDAVDAVLLTARSRSAIATRPPKRMVR